MKKFFLVAFSLAFLASCNATQNTTTTGATTDTTTGATTTTATEISKIEDKAVVGKTEDGAVTYGEGPARIQVFADFECPACQMTDLSVTPALEALAESGKITLEYRQFPLTSIHPNAFADANAALCAADQNVYRSYKYALYDVERKKSTVTNSDYLAIAESLGIANDTFKSCVNNSEKSAQVKADMAYGTARNVTGTPTYLMDGQPLQMAGFKTVDELTQFINLYVEKKYPTTTVEVTTEEIDENGGGVVEIAPEDATTTATGEVAQ